MRNWIVLAVVVAVAASLYAGHAMMAPTSGAMLEITSVSPAGTFAGRVLKKEERGYARTRALLRVPLGPGTRFVMGDRSDLRPGAVVQVSGDRIVILTGYVRVI